MFQRITRKHSKINQKRPKYYQKSLNTSLKVLTPQNSTKKISKRLKNSSSNLRTHKNGHELSKMIENVIENH